MENFKCKAQSLIEYGLILGLVVIIALTVLSKFGKSLSNLEVAPKETVQTVGNTAQNSYCHSIKSGSTFDINTGECTR